MKCTIKKIFIDKHTGERYMPDKIVEFTETRVKEIQAVDKTLIEPEKPAKKAKGRKTEETVEE